MDWNTRPRPVTEFFAKFTPPKSQSKLASRVKCNVYYYRANYFSWLVFSFVFHFFRNPFALVAVAAACFSLLCANDSFATALSESTTRTVRKVHPPAAAWMRRHVSTQVGPTGRAYGRAKTVYVCGVERKKVVAALALASVVMLYRTRAMLTVFWSLFWFLGGVSAHASMRSPNLKARLSSYREEFRAVWRGYAEA